MAGRYYLDTCIWRDYYEDRFGPGGRPLGAYATQLLSKILQNHDNIIISDILLQELKKFYSDQDLALMLGLFSKLGLLIRAIPSEAEIAESHSLSLKLSIPTYDALHVIIAKNRAAVFVTQDRHFDCLKGIATIARPDDLL